ncbi:choline transporter-like 2 [Daphnia magna]|uniref:choline transporter-like 2 n=1 Tax=Daphnia magna TaxID=35525 RepID=UPI001E1BC063|nr:choline transporter-like 2 [Daphnia magna]XP_045025452.1 choline transporter-like 2 [Daphnia magna]
MIEEADLERELVYRGPVKNRSCTDVVCLVIFIAFLVGWGIIGIYGFILGDPQRLLYPTDSYGRICGVDEKLKDKPYLFYFDLTQCADSFLFTSGCPTPQVCVKTCPVENFVAIDAAAETGEALTKIKMICKENVTVSEMSVKELVDKGYCASYYIHSEPLAGRCVPLLTNTSDIFSNSTLEPVVPIEKIVNVASSLAHFVILDRIFQEFSKTWWVILIGLAISMIMSFFWIVLMRFAAGLMIWLSIAFILVLQGVGTWYCFKCYTELKDFPEANNQTLAENESATNLITSSGRSIWQIIAIFLCIFMAFTILMLIVLRNRIRMAIALINHASNAVGDILSTLLFPIFPWVFQVLVIGYFAAVALYAASIDKSNFRVVGPDNKTNINCSCTSVIDSVGTCIPLGFEKICDIQCPGSTCRFFDTGADFYVTLLQIYNFLGLCWSIFFVSALSEIVLAGAFASWYWAFSKPHDVPAYPLANSFFRTVSYHLGTVAFGSLIISILRSIRVLLEILESNARENSINCCCCIIQFFVRILEKIIRFINRNAYVLCAINGTGFRQSASDASSLIWRNVADIVVLDKVTEFLLFLGRFVIVTTLGIVSFYVFTNKIPYVNECISPTDFFIVPIISTVLGAYFITGLFFSSYSMAVDTIFLCYLQDTEINDGSAEKPFYMSQELKEILGKKN